MGGKTQRDPREPASAPRLYGELASWWPLLSRPEDYAEEAEIFRGLIAAHARRRVRTLLELGSGGGNTASHLKAHFEDVTLVDCAPRMLEVSRALNSECRHELGDMRSVRLERRFDSVLVHDAICYMTTPEDLRAALATAFTHCEPGGVAVFAPDYVRESFREETSHGGHDGADRSLRYVEWVCDPDPEDTRYQVDYAYLLRERDGTVRAVHDRHEEGLFRRKDWLDWLREAGFDAVAVTFDHSEFEAGSWEGFVGRRPPA